MKPLGFNGIISIMNVLTFEGYHQFWPVFQFDSPLWTSDVGIKCLHYVKNTQNPPAIRKYIPQCIPVDIESICKIKKSNRHMCTIKANATTWRHAIESGSLDSASSVHQQITHFRFKLRAPKWLHLLESCTYI